jgi:hypothetical protein
MLSPDGVELTGDGKLVGKATSYEQELPEAGLSLASGTHWSVPVTHRFSDQTSFWEAKSGAVRG